MNSFLGEEQLRLRELGKSRRVRNAARLHQEMPTEGTVYALPVRGRDVVLAADVDPELVSLTTEVDPEVACGPLLDTDPIELVTKGSKAALLTDYDFRTWYMLDQIAERGRVQTAAGMGEHELRERLLNKTLELKSKVRVASLGAVAMSLPADVFSSPYSPPGTETIAAGLSSVINGVYMHHRLHLAQLALLDGTEIEISKSEELEELSNVMKRQGDAAAVEFLDSVDGIPTKGYTADRLNLAEMIVMRTGKDEKLAARLSTALYEIARLTTEFRVTGQILKATLKKLAYQFKQLKKLFMSTTSPAVA